MIELRWFHEPIGNFIAIFYVAKIVPKRKRVYIYIAAKREVCDRNLPQPEKKSNLDEER